MVVFALVIVLGTGSALAFLPVIGCVMMMLMMGRMGGHGDDRTDRK